MTVDNKKQYFNAIWGPNRDLKNTICLFCLERIEFKPAYVKSKQTMQVTSSQSKTSINELENVTLVWYLCLTVQFKDIFKKVKQYLFLLGIPCEKTHSFYVCLCEQNRREKILRKKIFLEIFRFNQTFDSNKKMRLTILLKPFLYLIMMQKNTKSPKFYTFITRFQCCFWHYVDVYYRILSYCTLI